MGGGREKQRGRETLLMSPDKKRSKSGCKQTGSESTQKKGKEKEMAPERIRKRRRSPSLVLPGG